MTTVTHTSRSEEETLSLAESLGRRLRGGAIVTLDGPLGAGKTCFVRGLAIGLGIDPREVSSPTFVLCHEHTTASGLTLAHLDAYRLSSADELEAIGWDDIAGSPDVIMAIEWPSRIDAALATYNPVRVSLDHAPDGARVIRIEGDAEFLESLA